MRSTELLRLVALNINQNKFKSVMTSIGIVVGAATIVLVIGIGKGGQAEVAEQFAELNAGAIDVTYEYEGEEESQGGGFSFGNIGQMFGNIGSMFSGMFGGGQGGDSSGGGGASGGMPSFGGGDSSGGMPSFGGGGFSPGGDFSGGDFTPGEMPEGFSGEDFTPGEMPEGFSEEDFAAGEMPWEEGSEEEGTEDGTDGESQEESAEGETQGEDQQEESTEEETSIVDDRLNQEEIILTQSDVEDIQRFVTDIDGAAISYSTQASIEGGNLTSARTYTVAGVKESYETVSKLTMAEGSFLTEADDDTKSRVCVLGSTAAEELFGKSGEITGSTLYIDDRAYTVSGVLKQTSTVSSGISPDTSIFIPYETGIKYVTGEEIDPVITVLASDVNTLSEVIDSVRTVLEENYPDAEFTFEDSGSKMEAAQSSNETLTLLLSAMAAIVFLVGGIGIMNVLFVAVKERTNEIGILKAIGTSRASILTEFLLESAAISCIGGILGVALSFGVLPIVQHFDVRVETSFFACAAALGFAVLTGTVFGIYPAWKASRLEPVEALNAE